MSWLVKDIAKLEDQGISEFDVNSEVFSDLVVKLDEIKPLPASDDPNVGTADNKQVKGRANIDSTMLDMFREEVESHGSSISDCLLKLENDPNNESLLEQLMRASHSIKGAARMVGVEVIVKIAHVM